MGVKYALYLGALDADPTKVDDSTLFLEISGIRIMKLGFVASDEYQLKFDSIIVTDPRRDDYWSPASSRAMSSISGNSAEAQRRV